MTPYETTLQSPVGCLRLIANEAHLTHALLPSHKGAPIIETRTDDTHPVLCLAKAQLEAYFTGERKRFDLPIEMTGTLFQKQVWAALQAIPWGETTSYGEIAKAIGRPQAVRAVGAANGRNPISIIVPCHRVIGRDGSLTGYAGGIPTKQWLLGHEDALDAKQHAESQQTSLFA